MPKSIDDLIKRGIHSSSTPVIINYNASSDQDSPEEAERRRRHEQDILIEKLAQQHFAERERGSGGLGFDSGGAPTMSVRSNYSDVLLNGSGMVADQSYTLDFSAQHTGTNPSFSSYDPQHLQRQHNHNHHHHPQQRPQQQQQQDSQHRLEERFYQEVEQHQHRTSTGNYQEHSRSHVYQDVVVIDEPPVVYVPSTIAANKSATASYNSYKSLKSNGCLPPANCDIKPVWVLTKVTRYITRHIRREKISL